jgi:hypothetical protein
VIIKKILRRFVRNLDKQCVLGIKDRSVRQFLDPLYGHGLMALAIDLDSPILLSLIAPKLDYDLVQGFSLLKKDVCPLAHSACDADGEPVAPRRLGGFSQRSGPQSP